MANIVSIAASASRGGFCSADTSQVELRTFQVVASRAADGAFVFSEKDSTITVAGGTSTDCVASNNGQLHVRSGGLIITNFDVIRPRATCGAVFFGTQEARLQIVNMVVVEASNRESLFVYNAPSPVIFTVRGLEFRDSHGQLSPSIAVVGMTFPKCEAQTFTDLESGREDLICAEADTACVDEPIAGGSHGLTAPTCTCIPPAYFNPSVQASSSTNRATHASSERLAPYLASQGCKRSTVVQSFVQETHHVLVSLHKTSDVAVEKALNLTLTIDGSDWINSAGWWWSLDTTKFPFWISTTQVSNSVGRPERGDKQRILLP
eukprot:6135346-Prymnesium_polylepis.1